MIKNRFVILFFLVNGLLDASPLTIDEGVANRGPEYGTMGKFLSFKSGSYTFKMQGPGAMTCSGKYKLKGPEIYLSQGTTDHNGSVDCSPRQCQIKTTTSGCVWSQVSLKNEIIAI